MANEKRLIDANALTKDLELLAKHEDSFRQSVILGVVHTVKAQPTVDAVEVVRCKDCRWARWKDHREPTETPRELICQCFKHHFIPAPWGARMAVSPDDFCSYGERKDNGKSTGIV